MPNKRGHNEGSIYRRADGRWCAALTLPSAGPKRQRKYIYASTRGEVSQRLTAALRDSQRGIMPGDDRVTVADYLTRWLGSISGQVKPRTLDSYSTDVRLHLVPYIGRARLTKLTAAQVQYLLDDLSDTLAPASVQHVHTTLRRALEQAMRWDLVPRNVATLVDAPRQEQAEIQPLDQEQTEIFLAAAKGDSLEALWSLAVLTGMRRGEMLALRWEDLDLDAGTLAVRHTLTRIDGKLTLTVPKSAKSRRTIHLPAKARHALRRRRCRQLEERMSRGRGEGEYVFSFGGGTPLDGAFVQRRFKALLTGAGLPDIRLHDLRHTAATLMLAKGIELHVVSRTLGHASISVTADIYGHILPTMQSMVAEKMDEITANHE